MLAAETVAGKRTPGGSVGQICDRTQEPARPAEGPFLMSGRARPASSTSGRCSPRPGGSWTAKPAIPRLSHRDGPSPAPGSRHADQPVSVAYDRVAVVKMCEMPLGKIDVAVCVFAGKAEICGNPPLPRPKVLLEILSRTSQPSGEQHDASSAEKSSVRSDRGLEVLTEAPIAVDPCKEALHDRASRSLSRRGDCYSTGSQRSYYRSKIDAWAWVALTKIVP